MKIQYASDLHLELPQNREWLSAHPLPKAGDILVLAGDTAYLDNLECAMEFLRQCSRDYREVLLLPGNHEYYGGLYDLDATLRSFELQILPNVRYLNNKSVVIDGTELFFTTLWTHLEPSEIAGVNNGMNDCRRISYRDRRFRAEDFNPVNARCLGWLAGALDRSEAARKVVVTHHCPLDSAEAMDRAGRFAYPAYCEPLPLFIAKNRPDVWIHGHVHERIPDRTESGTRVLCNAFGYSDLCEQEGFNPGAVIEI